MTLQSKLVLLCNTAFAFLLIYSTFTGKYGLEARFNVTNRSDELSSEISSLETVYLRLKNHVDLLSLSPPDPDIVEEIARRDLGFAYNDEVILHFKSRS